MIFTLSIKRGEEQYSQLQPFVATFIKPIEQAARDMLGEKFSHLEQIEDSPEGCLQYMAMEKKDD